MASFTADDSAFITACMMVGVRWPPAVPGYPTMEQMMKEGLDGTATPAGINNTLILFAGRLSVALEADPGQWATIKGVFLRVAKARPVLLPEYRARQREVRKWLKA